MKTIYLITTKDVDNNYNTIHTESLGSLQNELDNIRYYPEIYVSAIITTIHI